MVQNESTLDFPPLSLLFNLGQKIDIWFERKSKQCGTKLWQQNEITIMIKPMGCNKLTNEFPDLFLVFSLKQKLVICFVKKRKDFGINHCQ